MNTARTLSTSLAIVAATALVPASAADRWLHLRVLEDDGARVAINLPLALVEQVLPAIEVDAFEGGRLPILDEIRDEGGIDLRALLEAVRDADDGEYVTVADGAESVRVAKQGGYFTAFVDGEDGERVEVRLPIGVVDALLSAGEGELDLLAALHALGDHPPFDLVRVDDGDGSTVRVWIDDEVNPN